MKALSLITVGEFLLFTAFKVASMWGDVGMW